ncbi:PREDICTED: uncharacterized protein LOC108768651 [Trachymyrmex cornetzi]|uniref:uncharacterized protein LOC108768651 n=1 Tax=Trachymyrmex cornetzi TaxID=471704 RepID=UPI00084F2428|nr:PREDICTED: uncharacterized protein LOC108768651 [Trachymyrmex cornetzi]
MCEKGFVKANSSNLPQIDMFTVLTFLRDDDRFNAPEIRSAKASLNCRENYGDTAIGYVQLKREGDLCIVKCRVCPEHKVRSKSYSTTLIINEATEKIIDVQCHDCAAATGGCKHALAVLMWVHRRSEDPAPTEISCYWKKSRLSSVGTVLKYIEVKDLGIQKILKLKQTSIPDNSTFQHDVLQLAESKQIDCQISRLHIDLKCLKTNYLSLHRFLLKFYLNGGLLSEDFLTFASSEMTQVLCDEAERLTQKQSDCPLWYELRYGRITASKLYEAAHCTTDSRSFVKQITGASKIHETSAMLRGKNLEKLVLSEVERELGTQIRSAGLYLLPNYPALGASPDGITNEYIVEIKCPSNKKTLENFLSKDKIINPKYIAHMHLQMLATGRKKGLFCVADSAFESTKTVQMQWLTYDSEVAQDLIEKAMLFWKKNIFPLLLSFVQK